MGGVVKNHSSKVLWVVNTDEGVAIARRLRPGRRSPPETDADGFKAVDGTDIDGHVSWVKIIDLSTADVTDGPAGSLERGCFLCSSVAEGEFGAVTYADGDDWGVPI